MAGEEKTEKATPRKRQDVRKEGQVLQSREVVTAISVLGTFSLLSLLGKFMLVRLMDFTEKYISALGENRDITSEYVFQIAKDIIVLIAVVCGPIMIATGFIAIIATIVQTKGLFSTKSIKFKFSNLNPLKGIKRLFSLQTIISVLKGVIVISIISYIVYDKIVDKLPEISRLFNAEPIQGVAYLGSSVMDIVMAICILFAFVAAGDFLFQWWNFEKKIRMSKEEIKQEYKKLEGDPQIKQRIKQKQQLMAQQRMMSAVPTADVVIKNPTHYAVAIKYDINKDKAPVIVAKGKDFLALKIISIAEDNDVYVTENKPLAQLLYKEAEVGSYIPKDVYNAIAEILILVYNEKGRPVNL